MSQSNEEFKPCVNVNISPTENMTVFGLLIKSSMAKQSISMRKLSKLTNICASSISRIINNKQSVKLHHLIEFSKHLNIPIEQLLFAIGIGKKEYVNEDSYILLEVICDILKTLDIDSNSLVADIQKELKKYQQYAETEEGKKIIINEFMAKINALEGSGKIIGQLKLLYQLFCSKNIDSINQAVIGSALLYFILSTDVIPDYIFPIGYLDDAIAISLVLKEIKCVKK